MKKLFMVLPLVFLLCFTFSCKQEVMDSEKAANVIYDAFELEEDDKLEIMEFFLESQESAIAKFRLSGNQLSSRIIRNDAGWMLSEIQNKEDEWVSAKNYLPIKGKLIDESDKAIADKWVTLYELFNKEGELKASIKVGDGGILLNPGAKTNPQGSFTLIADRRFWEESGMFTLGVGYMGRTVYLKDQNNITISIKVDKNAKKAELGEIRVRY
ncbi:MAG: hypothetical protein WBE11_14060 [Candidatus Aminicenantaceae bacterium]